VEGFADGTAADPVADCIEAGGEECFAVGWACIEAGDWIRNTDINRVTMIRPLINVELRFFAGGEGRENAVKKGRREDRGILLFSMFILQKTVYYASPKLLFIITIYHNRNGRL
jgi:hypothetical protein